MKLKHLKLNSNLKFKIENFQKGFTLVELLVAIFIFSLVMVAIVSVFVSLVVSYGKIKAIKTVKENAEFAMNFIAKDVRMGKIESYYKVGTGSTVPLTGTLKPYLVVSRNRGGKVCYHLDMANKFLGIQEGIDVSNTCSASQGDYRKLIDLSGTKMTFGSLSGFYSLPTDTKSVTKKRGWVEMNINISMESGSEMSADQINIQTIISSRDYGWDKMP